jgi:EamA domain-containing membrane protein RarD
MTLPVWAQVLLQVTFFAIVILVVYKQLKERILFKYHPDKWIVLALAGLVFLFPMLSTEYLKLNVTGTVWQYLDSTIFIILFLWFVDISNGNMLKFTNKKNNKEVAVNMQKISAANKPKKNKNRDSRRR